MRYELLDGRPILPLIAAFLFAASSAAAQETPPTANSPPPAAGECFPSCRSGFLCHEGVCITGCNPPCEDDEKCTPEGECVAKASAPSTPPTVPVAHARIPPPAPPSTPRPLRAPQGIALGFAIGSTLCATPNVHGCHTADGDAGIYASFRGGYQFFRWLILGADLSVMPVFLKDDANAKIGLQLAAGIGARFFPLERRHFADLVLGLHAGYLLSFVKNKDDAPSPIETASQHAVYLAYEAGVEFNLRTDFSLGLVLDVFEPFWITGCSKVEGGSTSCVRSGDGANNQLFFGAGVSGTFLL